jgi:hypothetical protein
MVDSRQQMNYCRCCRKTLPIEMFYRSRTGVRASRCKDCHGLGRRTCHVCHRPFVGKRGRKACSPLCRELMRAPTFYICRCCGQLFGPVKHLKRKYCSQGCAYKASATGRNARHKPTRKARSAQSLLRYHVQAGNIARPTKCEQCGIEGRRIEGAHYNYDEPLRVRWLCVSCHRRWDARQPKGGTVAIDEKTLASARSGKEC